MADTTGNWDVKSWLNKLILSHSVKWVKRDEKVIGMVWKWKALSRKVPWARDQPQPATTGAAWTLQWISTGVTSYRLSGCFWNEVSSFYMAQVQLQLLTSSGAGLPTRVAGLYGSTAMEESRTATDNLPWFFEEPDVFWFQTCVKMKS